MAIATAALDQPAPTPELREALNEWLRQTRHDLAIAQPLTPKEVQVALLVAEGKGAGQIADTLSLRLSTVEKRIENISRKLPNPNELTPMRLITQWVVSGAYTEIRKAS